MKSTKKTRGGESKRPTYAELTEQLDKLRRKVWLLQKTLDGEAADLEFANACGITGSDTPEERRIRAGALRRCKIGLEYVMQGEG